MTHWVLIAILYYGRAGFTATFDSADACTYQVGEILKAGEGAKAWCAPTKFDQPSTSEPLK